MSDSHIPLSDLQSSPSAKFNNFGDAYRGRVVSMNKRPQTDIKGKVVTFDDGTPRMQWVIVIEQANGESVTLYAKGGKFEAQEGEGESMLNAIGSAVRAAGAPGVDIGAELAVAYTGRGAAKAGQDQPRLFKAQYRSAAPTSVPVDLFT